MIRIESGVSHSTRRLTATLSMFSCFLRMRPARVNFTPEGSSEEKIRKAQSLLQF